jgi:hypothetical protein
LWQQPLEIPIAALAEAEWHIKPPPAHPAERSGNY